MKKKGNNSKKMFKNNIVRQINEERKAAKVKRFTMGVNSDFYSQRIRPILLPFLRDMIANAKILQDESTMPEMVFCDDNSITGTVESFGNKDTGQVSIKMDHYIHYLTNQEQYSLQKLGLTSNIVLSTYFSSYTLNIKQRRPL